MNESASYYLRKLKHKYLILRSGEVLLLAFASAILLYGMLVLIGVSDPILFFITFIGGAVPGIIRFRMLKLHQLNKYRIVAFINRQYPSLQQSTDLLLTEDAALTSLQQLQKEKIISEFRSIYPMVRFPHRLGQAALFFFLSLGLTALLSSFTDKTPGIFKDTLKPFSSAKSNVSSKLPAAVKEIRIQIQPPSYTGQSSYRADDPGLTIPEGSQVQWNLTFTDSVKDARLIFSGGEVIKLNEKNVARRSCSKSTFYQISWAAANGEIKTSDYYKLEIVADEAPGIVVHQLQQFTQITVSDKLSIDLRSTLSDDYSVSDAFVIATVSKGSGESVKFREEKLLFTTPSEIRGKTVQASRAIDLIKLGLEPGDELYFYIEALDNKTPVANRSRTETFFIALKDTASQQLSVEGGLGVDLMPEYFRSQRQIIIDSEKLLRDRKNISQHEFNARSNELGYDQKVLRLKYGEFLGEEFESAIGPGNELPEEDHAHEEGEEEEDPKEKYGHVHDKENEHNLVPEKKQQTLHVHEHDVELDPEKKEDPAEAYKHQHDDPEEATFFTQSIRSKLKAALTVMWDAELHLRMYDPEKSLPYQYTALKLLKEISNDSRIYVHKTGFDPPPLKEEKRLSADLTEIKNSNLTASAKPLEIYPEIRKALLMIEHRILNKAASELSIKEKKILHGAGNELSALALEQPGKFLTALSRIKVLNENELSAAAINENLMEVRKAFWLAIPEEAVSPDPSEQTTHSLDIEFIKKLDDLKND